jgi:catechol 2,3-dioxygenase-like lactoylglutathione lyase family enzyme
VYFPGRYPLRDAPVSRTFVQRLHNPHNYECACDPDCWCRRTALGRAVKWWFPARYFGLHHKNRALEEWKRGQPEGALQAWKRRQARSSSAAATVSVVGVEPIFAVSDVPRAVEHYEKLGFTTSHHDAGYAFAHRNRLTIHLAGVDASHPGAGAVYMHVDDADRLADEWRNAGIDVTGPQDFEYGKREGSHLDPDGNLIRFGSPLPPPRR